MNKEQEREVVTKIKRVRDREREKERERFHFGNGFQLAPFLKPEIFHTSKLEIKWETKNFFDIL